MTDTVTAKLAEWEALVGNAPTGDYGLTYHTGTYEWQIVTDDKPTVQLMRAATEAMPALLGFVWEVLRLADWHETKAHKARTFPGKGHEAEMEKVARVHEDAAQRIRALTERIGGA